MFDTMVVTAVGTFDDDSPSLYGLSPAELQILHLVRKGMTSKEIASLLELSVLAVRSHRRTLMRKLKVNNVAELVSIRL